MTGICFGESLMFFLSFLCFDGSAQCPSLQVVEVAQVSSPKIQEVSGMIEHDNRLWIHNDSGDKPRIFSLSLMGELEKTVNIPHAAAKDWEDITVLRDPPLFFIGDVGDNKERRSSTQIYMYDPVSKKNQTMVLQYEGGPRDVVAP